jgi:hypothetical protein
MATPTPQPPARRKVGRPPIENPRRRQIAFRLTEIEYAFLCDEAALADLPPADFARNATLAAVDRPAPTVAYTRPGRRRAWVGRLLRRLALTAEGGR